MTEKMIQAGIAVLQEYDGQSAEELVQNIWVAMKNAKQKEAIETYWAKYQPWRLEP